MVQNWESAEGLGAKYQLTLHCLRLDSVGSAKKAHTGSLSKRMKLNTCKDRSQDRPGYKEKDKRGSAVE